MVFPIAGTGRVTAVFFGGRRRGRAADRLMYAAKGAGSGEIRHDVLGAVEPGGS